MHRQPLPPSSPQSRTPRRLLITGFEPFDGMDENLSGSLVQHLGRNGFGARAGIDVRYAVLPVSYAGIDPFLDDLLNQHRPDTVLAFGIGHGDALVTIERIAVNIDDASCRDNSGEIRKGTPIEKGAPAAYFTTLPVAGMAASLLDAGIPAVISNHAGAFLCNHVLYRLLHLSATTGNPATAGFFHLPRIPWSPDVAKKLESALHSLLQATAGIRSCSSSSATPPAPS